MLKFYFSTVLIYAIVIYASLRVLRKSIVDNGWLEGATDAGEPGGTATKLFLLAAVPVFRLVVVIMIFVMADKKKNDLIK